MTYEGSSVALSNARFLHRDRLGSVVMQADSAGHSVAINTYDEYGVPGQTNFGRHQYTGQVYIPEIGLYYYKARMYSPSLGRFMQTDPIGYSDGPNMYAYVGNNPTNFIDPTGLNDCPAEYPDCITVRPKVKDDYGSGGGGIPRLTPIPIPLPRGVGGGGGGELPNCTEVGDSGELCKIVVPGRRDQHEESSLSCDALLAEPGVIEVANYSGTVILLGGITGAYGTFQNTETGSNGQFFSLGGGAGFDIGGSLQYQRFGSLANFSGFGATLQGGSVVSGSLTWNNQGDFVGGGGGLATPGKGGSGILTGTKLFNCKAGK